MGTSRILTERQYADAKVALQEHVKELEAKGVEAGLLKKDPKWRQLDAKLRQIGGRIRRIAEIEKLNAELESTKDSRHAEREAEKAAKKEAKKAAGAAKKPKKDKNAIPAPGAKKDKGPKKEKSK